MFDLKDNEPICWWPVAASSRATVNYQFDPSKGAKQKENAKKMAAKKDLKDKIRTVISEAEKKMIPEPPKTPETTKP